MKLTSSSFANNSPIPPNNAFCTPHPQQRVEMGANRSPHMAWSGTPAGTRSFAMICVDPDVPTVPDNVNKEGTTLSADMPRTDFYHWVLVDIAPTVTELSEGADSDGVTPKGKPAGKTDLGVRGINDYTGFMASNPEMAGQYGGYDGPCPPWNDELLHHYVFRIYALDVETLGLSGNFTGQDAMKAMEGHILDQAEWTGTYTLNPDVKG